MDLNKENVNIHKKDSTNKKFWEKVAKIYAPFMAKNIVIEGKPLVECIITAVKNEKTVSCGGSRV